MNDLTCSSSTIDDTVRAYPTQAVLTAVGAGIILGVLARLLHERVTEPTSLEAALETVRGAGGRMRDLFH